MPFVCRCNESSSWKFTWLTSSPVSRAVSEIACSLPAPHLIREKSDFHIQLDPWIVLERSRREKCAPPTSRYSTPLFSTVTSGRERQAATIAFAFFAHVELSYAGTAPEGEPLTRTAAQAPEPQRPCGLLPSSQQPSATLGHESNDAYWCSAALVVARTKVAQDNRRATGAAVGKRETPIAASMPRYMHCDALHGSRRCRPTSFAGAQSLQL